jgi:hypothetical protein
MIIMKTHESWIEIGRSPLTVVAGRRGGELEREVAKQLRGVDYIRADSIPDNYTTDPEVSWWERAKFTPAYCTLLTRFRQVRDMGRRAPLVWFHLPERGLTARERRRIFYEVLFLAIQGQRLVLTTLDLVGLVKTAQALREISVKAAPVRERVAAMLRELGVCDCGEARRRVLEGCRAVWNGKWVEFYGVGKA